MLFGFPLSSTIVGPQSPLAGYLHDFGPALLGKFQPKAFCYSARTGKRGDRNSGCSSPFPGLFDVRPYHETVTDYEDKNSLLVNYHDFDPEFYKVKFNLRGDATLPSVCLSCSKTYWCYITVSSRDSLGGLLTPIPLSRLVSALILLQRTETVV